ncbi:MAG: sulfotransferase domain-containing protein [Anaerolineales bacterium]|nr:sulfotransferase domain-containing protein [Anaerolineales bacterium]
MSSTFSVNEPTPILVTGSHRSGTTWVGRMLAANTDTAYISEPLNVLHRPGIYRVPVKYWYTYITEENEADYLPAFHQLLNFEYHTWLEIKSLRSVRDFMRMGRDFHTFFNGSMHGQRALIKDPFAVFSSPWFAQKLNCKVVITARHPGGFASSLKRLGWNFDFNNFLNQPLFMRDHLEADRAAMESMDKNDIVGQSALLWKFIYRFVHGTRERFPDFEVVRHEDLSRDPLGGYEALYKKLGLDFTDYVKETILNSSSSDNPTKLAKNKTHSVKLDSRANLDNWKRILSPEEIQHVRKITEGVSEFFYTDEEWK